MVNISENPYHAETVENSAASIVGRLGLTRLMQIVKVVLSNLRYGFVFKRPSSVLHCEELFTTV